MFSPTFTRPPVRLPARRSNGNAFGCDSTLLGAKHNLLALVERL